MSKMSKVKGTVISRRPLVSVRMEVRRDETYITLMITDVGGLREEIMLVPREWRRLRRQIREALEDARELEEHREAQLGESLEQPQEDEDEEDEEDEDE